MASATVTAIPIASPTSELQKHYCMLKLGGEIRFVDRDEINALHAGIMTEGISMYKLGDGKLIMKRCLEGLPMASDPKKTVEEFLVSPNTLVYDAVAFSPLSTPANTLNYWIDPAIQPAIGNWSMIKHFLLNVICGGDKQCFIYLIYYLAHMLQKPEEKPGIMIVLLGGQGTGKGTFFRLLHAIWQRTTLQVSDVAHITGSFNAALERNFIVCMDEALFRGDKKAIDSLKSLVTEPIINIEEKYQPRRSIASYHRFFAASNHQHFAQVDQDDRRFLIFRVPDTHKGDFAYWNKMHAAISNPAIIAAMVHFLLKLDLSSYNVRNRPKTIEHMAQKMRSLTGFDRYWFEVLQTGDFGPCAFPEPSGIWGAPCFISTKNLMAGWQDHEKRLWQYAAHQEHDINEAMKRLCLSAKRGRKQFNNRQERGYELPDLPAARADFEQIMGGKVDWVP